MCLQLQSFTYVPAAGARSAQFHLVYDNPHHCAEIEGFIASAYEGDGCEFVLDDGTRSPKLKFRVPVEPDGGEIFLPAHMHVLPGEGSIQLGVHYRCDDDDDECHALYTNIDP